jgi:hypothetical protein
MCSAQSGAPTLAESQGLSAISTTTITINSGTPPTQLDFNLVKAVPGPDFLLE